MLAVFVVLVIFKLLKVAVPAILMMISVTTLIFIYIMNVRFISVEEEKMEKEFGKKYKDYTQRVRKWI